MRHRVRNPSRIIRSDQQRSRPGSGTIAIATFAFMHSSLILHRPFVSIVSIVKFGKSARARIVDRKQRRNLQSDILREYIMSPFSREIDQLLLYRCTTAEILR